MKNERTVSIGLLFFFVLSWAPVGCTQSGMGNTSSSEQTDTLRATNQWFTLAPNIDEFSVEMPGLTKSITQATPNTYMYGYDGRVYVLMASPLLADEEDENLSDEELLTRHAKTSSKSMLEGFSSSDPPKATPLTLKGASGIELRLSDERRVRVRRLYLRKKRLYSLDAIAPVSEAASVERFVNSFTFEREKPLQFLNGQSKEPGVTYGDPKVKPE